MSRQNKIIVGIILGFVLVIATVMVSVLTQTRRLRLYNIDQVESGLSGARISELEGFIFEGLDNAGVVQDGASEIKVLVRPASFTRAVKDGMQSYSFLIDVDEYQATYQVSFTLKNGQGFYETPNINCPAQNLMKYPETSCKSEKTSTSLMTIGRLLPYSYSLSDGRLVTIGSSVSEDGKEYLKVKVSTCGDKNVEAEVREGVEKWIASVGYEAETYNIVIPEYCDGEF